MNSQDHTLQSLTAALAQDESLVQLVERDQLTNVLSNWNYAARTNNHSAFTQYTTQIRTLSEKLKTSEANREKVVQFYESLLSPNNMKMVYRCLSQKKATTVSILRLLNNAVDYDRSLVTAVFNNIDLNSNILIGLLAKNDSIRSSFITFWLNLNGKLSYFDRKMYLGSKVWLNIFKTMDLDSVDTINMLLQFIEEKVLNESNFRKATKIKLVNESLLFSLQNLINKKDLDIPAFFHKVVDSKNGILFHNYDLNTVIKVNNKNFKIYNKILYNLLTFIKIDSAAKLNLATLVLAKDVSLIDPYMNWIIINGGGFHEPDLTSWYINHSLLYIKVLELATSTADTILLKPLSKTCLTKGLTHKSPMIVELNLQFLLLIFKKLDEVEDAKTIRFCLKNLPEVSCLMAIESDSTVIQMSVLKCIKYYSHYTTNLNASLVKYLNTKLSLVISDPSSLNLLKLRYIVSIKLNLNEKFEIKWYNKLNNTHCLFTNLVKVANQSEEDQTATNINNNLSYFYELLNELVDTDTFTTDSILNPIWSIIYYKTPEAMYSFLDEVIHKAVSNPYKYYDISSLLNLFVIVLLEQFPFHLQKSSETQQSLSWLHKILQSLIIIGQPRDEIVRLCKRFHIEIDQSLLDIGATRQPGDHSIAETVVNNSNSDLDLTKLKSKFIMNDYDLCCVVVRVQLLAEDASAKSSAITELFGKISTYISGGHFEVLDNKQIFLKFLIAPNASWTKNQEILLTSFNELLKSSPSKLPNIQHHLLALYHTNLGDDQVQLLGPYNWILDTNQLQAEYPNEILNIMNYKLLISKSIQPVISVDKLLLYKSEEKLDVLAHLMASESLLKHIDFILEKGYYSLLSNIDDEVLNYLSQRHFTDKERAFIGSIVDFNPSSASLFTKVDLRLAQTQLAFPQYLRLFKNCLLAGSVDFAQIQQLLQSADTENTFIPEFVSVLSFCKEDKAIEAWLFKSTIHITKQFAEQPDLSDDFFTFLEEFSKLLQEKAMPPLSLIDTQLEVILRSSWVRSQSSLAYVNRLLMNLKKLDNKKYLEVFLNNEHNLLHNLPKDEDAEARIESALVVYNLFLKKPYTNILSKILPVYNGSTRLDDLILKKLLVKIEEISLNSWVSQIQSWDLNKLSANDVELVGEQRLLMANDNRFTVSLNLNFIENMLTNNVYFQIPDKYEDIAQLVKDTLYQYSYKYEHTVYDPEFLLLLLLNNEEFFKFDQSKVLVSFKNLINYNILEVLIKHFKSSVISRNIVKKLVTFIDDDDSFKDKNLFKIYLSNLLNTPAVFEIQLKIYSSFIPILANPTHHLYEMVYKYVLSHPTIRGLPLFNKVKQSEKRIIDTYLQNFITLDANDLQLLNSNNFIEWVLNLLNLASIPESLESTILRILFNLCDIDNGGFTLITKYSIVSFLEQLKTHKNPNVAQISAKLGILSSKRAVDWTIGDIHEHVKRQTK